MAGYDALKAGKWDDTSIWFDAAQDPPTPAGPPAAGDIAVIDALIVGSGSQFTGTASVLTLMVNNSNTAAAALTFNGSFSASSDIDLTSTPGPTPAPFTVTLFGAFSAGHQLEIGTNTALSASSATIFGPTSGTIGIQDSGSIILNSSTLSANLTHIVGTLDVENSTANLGTLQVGAPVGNTGSLTIASGSSVVDTFGTIGTTNAGLGLATVNGAWDNQQLTVGHAGTGRVVADGGAMITAQGGGLSAGQQALMIGELSSGKGTLEVDSASVQVTGDAGIGINGKGTLVVNTGGQVSVTGSLDTAVQFAGAGELDINGGALTVDGSAILGDVASGQMTIAAGGSVSIGTTLTLGAQLVGNGGLTLTGTNAQLQTGVLVVGGAGIGTATLGDQTDLSTSSDVVVGATQILPGSKGTLTLLSGSSLSDGGNLIVGDAGTGTLVVNGGALSLLGSSFIVGNATTGNGDVSIQTSTVAVLGTVTIGNAGQANVAVNTGGGLTGTSIILGAVTGGNGSLALDGSESTTSSGDITIGASGVGAVQVTNSAALTTSGTAILASTGGPVQQTATVDSQASWQIGSLLDVGLAGSAELVVQGGGQVAAGQIDAGDGVGSDGTIVVSGTNAGVPSALSFGSTLTVGNAGTGMMQITGGASVGSSVAGTGTIAVGAMSGSSGLVTLDDTGSSLSAQVLSVGGGATAVGGAGTLDIGAGATVIVSAATIWQTGTVNMSGGALLTDPITIKGTLSGFGTLSGSVTNTGAIVVSNGTLDAKGSLGGPGVLELATGSTAQFEGVLAANEQVVFDTGSPETLILGAPGSGLDNAITGLSTGNRVEFGSGMTITSVSQAGSTWEVAFTNGGVTGTYDLTSVTFAGGASGFTFGTDSTTSDDFVQALCFCSGTQIATPDGDVSVERLSVGDLVLTQSGVARPIVWIGIGQVLATPGRRTAATPVIVRKGAFADNVPTHDLRVTKGHSFYIDGVLIPAEFLVNYQSILWDDRAQEVTLYHVELESHDVLLANGAAAESYRDDGNRWLFRNANTGWNAPPKPPCAPVLTGGPLVDATWRRLLDRVGPRCDLPLTDDPDVHLLVDGRRIDPSSRHDAAFVFPVPTSPASVRLMSRAGAPAELGLARDPRVLGVAIRRLVLRRGTRFRIIEPKTAELTDGFHTFEPEFNARWTDGSAGLPAAWFAAFDGATELVIHLAATTQYSLFVSPRSLTCSGDWLGEEMLVH